MKQKELMNILSSKKRGQLIRIQYQTFPKLTAEAERMKVRVVKFTETTVRWGINYSNIAAVIAEKERKAKQVSFYKPWWHWAVPNVIQQHNSKPSKYFAVYTIPQNANVKVDYFIIYNNGCCEQVSKQDLQNRKLVQDSYWAPKEAPIMYSISLENIIRIK